MATAKKTTVQNRNASSRKTTASSGRGKNSNVKSSTFQNEVIMLVVLAASVILMISVLGFGGIVGNVIGGVLFGVFGLLSYAVPVIFFIGCAFLLSNHSSGMAFRKILASVIFIMALCGLLQAVTEGYLRSNTLLDYYALSSAYRTGGGIVGGAVCFSMSAAFGEIGGIVIILLVLFVCLIVITQRSFFDFVFRVGEGIASMFRSGRERYQEGQPERELRREMKERQRQQLREERRAERMRRLEESMEEDAYDVDDMDGLDEFDGLDDLDAPSGRRAASKNSGFLAGTDLKAARKPARTITMKNVEEDEPEPDEGLDEDLDEDSFEDYIKPAKKPARAKVKGAAASGNTGRSAVKKKAAAQEEAPEREIFDMDFSINRMEEPSGEDLFAGEDPYEDAELPVRAAPVRENVSAAPEAPGETAKEDQPAHRQTNKNPRSSKEEISEGVETVAQEIRKQEQAPPRVYHYPPLKLMKKSSGGSQGDSDAYLRQTAQKLQETLYNFGVNAKVTNVSCGPTVTRFELQPEMGVKVSKILSLSDDIQLNLATADIRIEAPIPGKAAVGIEVPNKEKKPVMLRELLESDEFRNSQAKLSFAVGKDIAGKPVVTDIAKMPHLLIAGATGSGKSVCINTLIVSILYKASPDEVKLIMIDPKVVELSVYNGIPHLFIPVVTDPKKAAGALNWAVAEMTQRYNTFAEFSVRNIKEYNRKVEQMQIPEGQERPPKLPQIVIIVDELADLMMVAPGEVEDAICRLAQLARAAGIHLVIATQRPSVNVITGVIKANMPSRIAFSVSSGVDSRTILDMNGAEKLLGQGDMLFHPQNYPKPVRLQGSFISDDEVSAIVQYLSDKNPRTAYDEKIGQQVASAASGGASAFGGGEERDVYFEEAGRFIIEKDKASIGMLQRMFKIGFNRAARIMDQLSDAGVVGPEEGTKPRKVLMTPEQFENYLEENG